MSGVALFETMSQQIAEQCGRGAAEARREADGIEADARAKSRAHRDATLKTAQSEVAMLKLRWEQKAEAEAAKAALLVRKETVEEVLSTIDTKIRSIVEGPDFPAVLDALLAELMAAVSGDDDVVLLAPEAHADHVRAWLKANDERSVTVEASSAMWDGVAVQDAARTYRISNSLAMRFRRVESEIRKVCATTLFGGDASSAD